MGHEPDAGAWPAYYVHMALVNAAGPEADGPVSGVTYVTLGARWGDNLTGSG